ncbi:hypothetical protein SAMN06265350_10136 [Solitalea koreensis]|uniref:Uncharacterized protein n=2 Tax=Solitalea koreensis TaxID=543615 RepID=A0A521ABD4_9SPHI|nr:hypothetical protein SAMN06265350_10136 [Solitalea koreensis]
MSPDSNKAQSLYLNINSFNYFRNYEYYNQFADGKTLFGTRFVPSLIFYPNENLALKAGILVQGDFGADRFRAIEPVFTLKYQKKNIGFTFGAIEGNINHRYIEPLYDYERLIYPSQEYGAQFLINSNRTFLDAWVHWEHFIYPGEEDSERITGGLSSDFNVIKKDRFDLSIPAQVILFHLGGQLDTTGNVVQTITNGTLGFKAVYKFNNFLKSIYSENYFVFSKELTGGLLPYQNGKAAYLNLGADFKYFKVMTSYFYGNKFINVEGAPLYSSLSRSTLDKGHAESERNLLFFRVMGDFKLAGSLYLTARIEPYIDLNHPQFDYSQTLYLNYRSNFLLKKKIKITEE